MVLRPFRQGKNDRDQAAPGVRQLILYPDGNFREDRPLQQTVRFENAQRVRQHLGGNVGDELAQLPETGASVFTEQQDDEERPLVAEP